MSTHRPPRGYGQMLEDSSRVQRTGGELWTRAASPVPEVTAAVSQALGSVGDVTEVASQIDTFELTSDGPQDKTLTYLPSAMSWNVTLNGLTALDAVDYEIDGQTLSLLSPLDARTDDWVQVQYDYLTGLPATIGAEPSSDSPIAYYHMDETSGTVLLDSSGNGRDGTYSGSPTLGSAPLIATGTSVTFSTTSCASVPAASIPALGHSLTFECWIASSLGTGIHIFLGCDDDTERALQFRLNNGKPEVILLGALGIVTVTGPSSKADGNAHHCVATYDNTTIRLYVDGSEVATGAATGDLGHPTTVPWTIANRFPGDTSAPYGTGRIDEVAIYDYALTADQVYDHYLAGL